MSWECPCGVLNRESKLKCTACGTPKGMVWTPEGFKPPAEAAALGYTVPAVVESPKQGYAGGVFTVIGAIFLFVRAVLQAPQDPFGSAAEGLLAGLLGTAAATRQPWGWYTLLALHVFGFIFSIIITSIAIANWDWSGFISIAYAVVEPMWFIYFYKRRAMFGAKTRWRWFERTFPNFVGPEEHALGATMDAKSFVPAEPTKAPGETEAHAGGKITIVKGEPEYLTKRCPRCAEQMYLEDSSCQYCDHQFTDQELAAVIGRVLEERKAEFAPLIDFASTTKQCPACSESIKLGALICRYCRHEFTHAAVQIAKLKALRETLRRVR